MVRPDVDRFLTPILAATALIVVVLAVRKADGSGDLQRLGAFFSGGSGDPAAPDRDPPPPTGHGASLPSFRDATAEAGLTFVHERGATGEYWIPELIGAGGALLDADGDGDLDLYLVQGGRIVGDNDTSRNQLLLNDGDGRFSAAGAGSGADVPGYGMGAVTGDYDGDGDVDLYVTRLGPNVLLANDGSGQFTDVTREAGVGDPGYGTSAAFFDYDGDGRLDLYVVNYLEWSPGLEHPCFSNAGVRDYCNPTTYPPQPDRLYRNRGDGRFEDVTEASGIGALSRDGLAVLCTDLDDDGLADVYVANDQMPAFFWRNRGDGTFSEEAMLAGCAFDGYGMAIAGMGIVAEDLDADGDYDLLVSNILEQSHLGLRNDGGMFEDASRRWGLGAWSVPYTGWSLALFDQDHDGELDLFVANGHVNNAHDPMKEGDPFAQPNQFARRGADGRFEAVPRESEPALAPVEVSRTVLTGDVDGDGDLDLVVTNNGGPARLLINEASRDSSWTLIDVRNEHGSPAVGARLEVTAGGRTWRREVRPQSGYLASHDPRVHVGLAGADRIERLVVIWPGGARDEAEDLPVRRRLRLDRAPDFAVTVLDEDGR